MQLASTTTSRVYLLIVIVFTTILTATAQENSPYSRYGLGDFFYGQHIINRSMGGLSVAYADGLSSNVGQSVNFSNPASYANFNVISYDLGVMIENRTLRRKSIGDKFATNNFTPSYAAFATPLSKKHKIGMAFGIRPISRINYSIQDRTRSSIDSNVTLYQGNGSLNQLFVGFGKKFKNLSFGFNTGLNFGSKDISTKKAFINDSVPYNNSNSETNTSFKGLFLNGGLQYEIVTKKWEDKVAKTTNRHILRLGLAGSLGNSLNASQNVLRETFAYSSGGTVVQIDSVFQQKDVTGKIKLPSNYTVGFTYQKNVANSRGNFDLWMFGAEFTTTQWRDYRFYNQADNLVNSWQIRVGGQFSPNPMTGTSTLSAASFRAGAFLGKDYINANGKELKLFGFSVGAGIPVRKWRSYDYQFTIINTAIEFGKRGSDVNDISENWFRFSFGLSLSDLWYRPRKYD